MAWPSTAKNAVAESNSSHSLTTSAKCVVAISEGNGFARDVIGNTPGTVSAGVQGIATGPAPAWSTSLIGNGLTESVLRFSYSSRAICFRGSGWNNSNEPTSRTIAAVIKIDEVPLTTAVKQTQIVSTNAQAGHGIGVSVGTDGALTLGLFRSSGFLSSSIALESGHWYAVAIAIDGTSTRTWFVYDYTDQNLDADGTTTVDGASIASTATPADAAINPCFVRTYNQLGFLGDVASFVLHETAWDSSAFQSYYEDPFGMATGSYAPSSGTLVTGSASAFGEVDGVKLFGSRPTSGVSSGSYTYQWHRSETPDFTPSGGTLLSGATSLFHNDTTAIAGTVYWYKLAASDGTSTVYTGHTSSFRKFDHFKLGFIGDSLTVVSGTVNLVQQGLMAAGYLVTVVNRGHIGAGTGGWITGGTYIDAALTELAKISPDLVLYQIGTNDAAGSLDAASYSDRVAETCGILTDLDYTVVLNVFPYKIAATDFRQSLLKGYLDALIEIANGSTIILGDTNNFLATAGDYNYAADGVHWGAGDWIYIAGANWLSKVKQILIEPSAAEIATAIWARSGRSLTA